MFMKLQYRNFSGFKQLHHQGLFNSPHLRMKMVEQNDDSNGEIIDGLDPSYGEYDKILDIFDFPLESLEGDDKDWDASNSQDLGPIPVDAFMGFYHTNIENESVNKGGAIAKLCIESEKKEEVDCVVTYNNTGNNTVRRHGVSTLRQNVISPETHNPNSVLESSGTCSPGESLPIRVERVIPVRARSKLGRPSNVNPWVQKTPIACAVPKMSSGMLPIKKRPRTSEVPAGLKGFIQQAIKRLPEDPNHTENLETPLQQSVGTRRCTHCHVTKTPQWREGPLGKNTLCNACGVRYRSGRLFPEYRPAASPTFTPSLHSNSHRKVIEMRKKAIQEPVLEDNPTSLTSCLPNSFL